MSASLHPTHADLLRRMRNTEDSFTERKSINDARDWVKTIVAFSNSVPLGHAGILYIGVRDNGEPEGKTNFDSIQKTLGEKAKDIYPAPFYTPTIIQAEGKEVLAVVIPGSPNRPHFAGPSYIRDGSVTRLASERQFNDLVAERENMAYELRRWVGKDITLDSMRVEHIHSMGHVASSIQSKLLDANQFYVIFSQSNTEAAVPLQRIALSFDPENKRLRIEVYPTRR
jgi:predicted HTH transcriptional regulator